MQDSFDTVCSLWQSKETLNSTKEDLCTSLAFLRIPVPWEGPEELIPRYRRQLALYRQALEKATPYPVRECALYSLRLDQAVLVPEG